MTCKHRWQPSEKHEGYKACVNCGTYRVKEVTPPASIYYGDYWSEERGHSTITDQVHNIDVHEENGVSKNEFIRALVHTDDRTGALDIGCAPGKLLYWLKCYFGFRRVVGVDVDPRYEADIRRIGMHGGELLFGFFPESAAHIEDGAFSLITALDVLEHVEDPISFLAECRRLLKPEGQLILMLPLVCNGMDERFFNTAEHIWIYSHGYLMDMLSVAGFVHLQMDQWTKGHDVITGMRGKV